jgi:hypothetical protein
MTIVASVEYSAMRVFAHHIKAKLGWTEQMPTVAGSEYSVVTVDSGIRAKLTLRLDRTNDKSTAAHAEYSVERDNAHNFFAKLAPMLDRINDICCRFGIQCSKS